MRKLMLGVIVALALLLLSASPAMAASPRNCDSAGWAGDCTASSSGSQVDLSASTRTPGSGTTDGSESSRPNTSPAPAPSPPRECTVELGCRALYSVGTLPDVSIDDLASFRPTPPTIAAEPAGFAVRGVPAVLVAQASEQVLAGELLGFPVQVRFTPVGFVFDHGDRTTAEVPPTPGGAGASRHTYRQRGVMHPALTVTLAASVDFGSGWRPVAGTVAATAQGAPIEVLEARTALVEHTCLENPAGIGC